MVVITKEIGENGFGGITNNSCLRVVIWWGGGGPQKATAMGVALGGVQVFPPYSLKAPFLPHLQFPICASRVQS